VSFNKLAILQVLGQLRVKNSRNHPFKMKEINKLHLIKQSKDQKLNQLKVAQLASQLMRKPPRAASRVCECARQLKNRHSKKVYFNKDTLIDTPRGVVLKQSTRHKGKRTLHWALNIYIGFAAAADM